MADLVRLPRPQAPALEARGFQITGYRYAGRLHVVRRRRLKLNWYRLAGYLAVGWCAGYAAVYGRYGAFVLSVFTLAAMPVVYALERRSRGGCEEP